MLLPVEGAREDQEIVSVDLVEAGFVERLVVYETAGLVDYYECKDGPVVRGVSINR